MAERHNITELLRLYVGIALCRRGPQDLPPSVFLLGATIAAYVVSNLLLGALLPPMKGNQLAFLAVDTLLSLAWYKAVVTVAGRPARFTQTAIASFGFGLVLTPLAVPAGWLTLRFSANPDLLAPLFFLQLTLIIWTLAVTGRILHLASEWPMFVCVMVVLLQFTLQQAVFFALFPQG